MSYQIALKVKEYLVNLAVNDKLPMDMNDLDELAIQGIIEGSTVKSSFGFTVGDIESCTKNVNEWRQKRAIIKQIKYIPIVYTEKFGNDVLDYMDRKGDASLGVDWDTIEMFINERMGV